MYSWENIKCIDEKSFYDIGIDCKSMTETQLLQFQLDVVLDETGSSLQMVYLHQLIKKSFKATLNLGNITQYLKAGTK